MKNWQLQVSEEVWGLSAFSKILKRDKSKDKVKAMKEVLFIYFYSDIKSDYIIYPDDIKTEEIKKDIGLPKAWQLDPIIKEAIALYEKNSQSIIEQLYKNTLKAASDIGEYLENTKSLLAERDLTGKPVYDIAKLTTAVDKVPKLMSNLKDAYKEVVKEQEDMDNKKKGSRSFNTFEDGL